MAFTDEFILPTVIDGYKGFKAGEVCSALISVPTGRVKSCLRSCR